MVDASSQSGANDFSHALGEFFRRADKDVHPRFSTLLRSGFVVFRSSVVAEGSQTDHADSGIRHLSDLTNEIALGSAFVEVGDQNDDCFAGFPDELMREIGRASCRERV